MEFIGFGKVIFLLFLVILIVYEVTIFVRGRSSEDWKPILAKVLDVGVECRENEGTEESKPFIKYKYSYLGGTYTGSKVRFGDLWSSCYGKASTTVSGIVKGSDVTVYINPKRPNQSVLHQGYEGNVFWQLGLIMAIVVFVAIS